MSEVITKINRERGFNYRVDNKGNILKEKYNWFKDPYTLVAIAILILGGLYYSEVKSSETNAENFPAYCDFYSKIKADYTRETGILTPSFGEVLRYYESNKDNLELNLSGDIIFING
jgi:hypothetical protein